VNQIGQKTGFENIDGKPQNQPKLFRKWFCEHCPQ